MNAVVLAQPNPAQGQNTLLPESDPTREWLGEEYAETVFASFKAKYPDISLVIDVQDLNGLVSADTSLALSNVATELRTHATSAIANMDSQTAVTYLTASRLKSVLVETVSKSLPNGLADLASSLEHGNPIDVASLTPPSMGIDLEAWLKAQPVASVTPHDFMVEALARANGHVLAAWAVAWNVLRSQWRASMTRNYGERPSQFISLTGEKNLWHGAVHYVALPRSEWKTTNVPRVYVTPGLTKNDPSNNPAVKVTLKRIVTKRGDEFSYLYHRIGVELLTMTVAKMSQSSKVGWAVGSAGALGEYLKFKTTAGLPIENKKRVGNDFLAAQSGAHLYKLIEGKATPKTQGNQCSASCYLRSNAKKFNAKYQLPPDRPAEYFKSNADPKFWADTMSEEELAMRFYHATHVDEEILNPVVLSSSGAAERLHRGLIEYMKNGASNSELNHDIKAWLDGVRVSNDETAFDNDVSVDPYINTVFAKGAAKNYDFDEVTKRLKFQLTRVLAVAHKEIKSCNTVLSKTIQ